MRKFSQKAVQYLVQGHTNKIVRGRTSIFIKQSLIMFAQCVSALNDDTIHN